MTPFQEIFESKSQAAFDLAEPRQNGLEFPLTLAERYQPRRIRDFVGLDYPKTVMTSLLAQPKPCALTFIGPPGAGKTALGMAFAEELPGSLMHLAGQKCDVATLNRLSEQFAYYPPKGKFWVCLVDEAPEMTSLAQLQLLSKLDGTAKLKPVYGGGFEAGDPPPIIWIFTGNGRGEDQTEPPASLLPRFLSRTLKLKFHATPAGELEAYLKAIWLREAGGAPLPDLAAIARESLGNVRDALMQLDLALMAGPVVTTVTIVTTPVCRTCGAEIARRRLYCDSCYAKRHSVRRCTHKATTGNRGEAVL